MPDEYETDDWYEDEWVDVDDSSRWHPRVGERLRAAIFLLAIFVVMGLAVLAASPGRGDGTVTAAQRSTTTTEPVSTTSSTTTTLPKSPESIDGAPPSERCQTDDRGAAPLRTPFESTVLVLNGTPRAGHAGETTDSLKGLGYTTSPPDNASIRSKTTIAYRPGFCAEAEQLAADLAVADVEIAPHPEDDPVVLGAANLLVVLGRDSLT